MDDGLAVGEEVWTLNFSMRPGPLLNPRRWMVMCSKLFITSIELEGQRNDRAF